MTEEKIIDATADKNKFADELLSDDELDNVAGGTGGNSRHHDNERPGATPPGHCHYPGEPTPPPVHCH